MKKDEIIIIATTFTVCFMILIFTVMIIKIKNSNDNVASGTEAGTEVSFIASEAIEAVNNTQIDEVVYSSDEIDLVSEDTAVRDVVIENTYVNTQELLPSILNKHEVVLKKNVSTDNFSTSFAGDESATITVEGKAKGNNATEGSVSVLVPASVTLYNVDSFGSGSYNLTVQIAGDNSIIKSIGYSSFDSSIIKLSRTSGYSTTISLARNYVGSGSVKVIVTYYTDGNSTATEAFNITVNVVDMDDGQTKLYDLNGIELFTDEDGKDSAYLKDYAACDFFYGAIKTTGWQTIEGKTYYYDYNSWPVVGNQIIGGIQYTFDEAGVLISENIEKGIDVSLYQKEIDWNQVAASGISFAIIRCGFRGAVSGKLVEDSYFRRNIEGAKAAGIKVGVYFFTQAITEEEALEEADMVLNLCRDYSLDLPIFIDSEEAKNGRANNLNKQDRTKYTKVFCERITEGGQIAGVYASKVWFYDKLNTPELEKYSIWVAQYNNICDYTGKKDFWQYSSTEKINGIEGNVDVDIISK